MRGQGVRTGRGEQRKGGQGQREGQGEGGGQGGGRGGREQEEDWSALTSNSELGSRGVAGQIRSTSCVLTVFGALWRTRRVKKTGRPSSSARGGVIKLRLLETQVLDRTRAGAARAFGAESIRSEPLGV
eukprot:COSAG02_NODE_1680_length_11353_cov_12.755909_3_plen_129_part_00